jgi:cytochrome c oxidase cbb3-type subunit 1
LTAETNEIPDSYATAKAFCLTSAFWMMVATFYGLLGATELIAPDLFANLGGIVFGRVRPTHINLVLFGFVTPGLLGSAFFFIPRLLGTPLYSERLGVITAVAWNAALVALVATLAMGLTQGREYAEMIWPIDVAVVAVFSLAFFNFTMTVARRREKILYVSVWYVLAGCILTACTYALGNVIWRPDTGALVGIPMPSCSGFTATMFSGCCSRPCRPGWPTTSSPGPRAARSTATPCRCSASGP